MITYNKTKLKELLGRDHNGNKMLLRRILGGNNETITRFINGEDIYVGKLVTICNQLGYDLEEFFIRDDESLLRLPAPQREMPAEQASTGQEGQHGARYGAGAPFGAGHDQSELLVQHARELAEVQVAERERECDRLRDELSIARERLLEAYEQIGRLKAQVAAMPTPMAHSAVNEKPANYEMASKQLITINKKRK